MPKLNLLEILKNTIVEQAPIGLYNYGDVGKYGLDLTTNTAVKIEKRDLSKDNKTENDIDSEFDLNSPLLIKPSTKRGSPFNDFRGYRIDKNGKKQAVYHKGVDYGVVVGTLLVVIKPGVVTRAGMNENPDGWGALIQIAHDDGSVSRYAHLSEIYVSENETIKEGKIIGATGGAYKSPGAGNSQGPHLHFEYLVSDSHKDPGTGLDDDTFRFLKKSDKNNINKKLPEDNFDFIPTGKYILGKKMAISKNGPENHQKRTDRKRKDWQSGNATDIFSVPGTIVYSITKGTVSRVSGNQSDHSGTIYGGNVTVKGSDGYPDIFYTHMKNIKVSNGQKVDLGTPIGEITNWEDKPSSSHVHVGLPWGENLNSLINLDTAEILSRN